MLNKKHHLSFLLLSLLTLSLLACQADLQNPPRLATATARASQASTPGDNDPLVLPAPTATGVAAATSATTAAPRNEAHPQVTVWINETSAAHKTALQAMAADLSQQHGLDLSVRLVSDALLPDLVNTAVLSGTLPDLILHPVAYTAGWAERGVLDSELAGSVLAELGADSFNPAALPWVTGIIPGDETAVWGLPSDGYQQLIIYRSDWFTENALAPPLTYQALISAAATIHNPDALISGFVIPTESNLMTTMQAFEHLALANGCQLIADTGEVTLIEPACQDALTFYYNIVHQYSPIGVQTDTSTERAYLAGRTGLIMAPPTILPLLANLDVEKRPLCPECAAQPDFLAQNSAILTQVTGSSAQASPANYSEMTVLGFTTAANQETAATFARYWFTTGYPQWLAVESERKVPLRWGTADQPRQFIDQWGQQPLVPDGPSLTELFGLDVVITLRDNMLATPRWGFAQNQAVLITKLYEEYTFPITLQEMLSGYFSSDQSIFEAYKRVIELIPNYPFADAAEQPDTEEATPAPEE